MNTLIRYGGREYEFEKFISDSVIECKDGTQFPVYILEFKFNENWITWDNMTNGQKAMLLRH